MGLGGYLMWTAVGREVSKRTGLKCLPVESHGPTIKMINSSIFCDNPYFIQPGEIFEQVFPIILNNPNTNYCKEDTPERAIHRHDKHVIAQICEAYGINYPELKCDIFFNDEEGIFLNDFISQVCNERYVTIEPHTKDEYTVNKIYPFEKWQHIVDEISPHIKVVQIGQKTDKILSGCINMTGCTTFRGAAALISKSDMFIGPEGGLMHAANATGVKSAIVITGFLHPTMTCYPDNFNIWVGNTHGPCGLKIPCEKCKTECENHNPNEIVDLIKIELKI